MGYTTDFEGRFELDKQLTAEHSAYLHAFSETRRMRRNPFKLENYPDPLRIAVNLPLGSEGEFFVGSYKDNDHGQSQHESILDYNSHPKNQHGLWCKWIPSEDNKGIEWSGAEKFYSYVEWLQYIIDNFLKPWGYSLSGQVSFQGEDKSDKGIIHAENNMLVVEHLKPDGFDMYPVDLGPEITKQIQDKIDLASQFLREAGDIAREHVDSSVLDDSECMYLKQEETETFRLNIFDLIDGISHYKIESAMDSCGWRTSSFYC